MRGVSLRALSAMSGPMRERMIARVRPPMYNHSH